MRSRMLLIFAAFAVPFAASQQRSQGCPAIDSPMKELRLPLLAKQPDGLHKAALANCGSFETGTAIEDTATSLEDLVKRSSVILVGEPTAEKVLLVYDGRYIVTEDAFHVMRALKGAPSNTDHTTLVMMGGSYKFEDGTQATESCSCRKPLIGHTYVIFSNPLRLSSQKLVPSFYDQGIIELASDGVRVIPYSTQFLDFFHRPSYGPSEETQTPFLGDLFHRPRYRYFEETQTQFLGEVQVLIANQTATKQP